MPIKKLHCPICNGLLGVVEEQMHENPDFREYRTCPKCGYEWAKRYWKQIESDNKAMRKKKNASDNER